MTEYEQRLNLRKQAKELGLVIKGQPSLETLQQLVGNAMETQSKETNIPKLPEGVKNYLSEAEYRKKKLAENKREAGKLIRCRITCMNPQKKNWSGEIISVGSSKMGTFKKFIPFNLEEPYHVPKAVFDYLKERKCRIGSVQKLPNGQEINKYKLINEFAIEQLPPLTKPELEDLRHRQAMAQGVA